MVSSPQAAKERAAALRRVAIVLSSLPAPVATRLLGSVDPDSKRQLRRAMTSLADVDPMERRMALQHFTGSLKRGQASTGGVAENGSPAAVEDEVTLSSASRGAAGSSAAPGQNSGQFAQDADVSSSKPEVTPSTLSFLSDVDDDQLIAMLAHEHPQTIALVFASIAPSQAARLLPRLDPDQRQDAMSRIGRLGEIPDEALNEVAQHLRCCVERKASSEKSSSGQRALDAILAELAGPAKSDPANETVFPQADRAGDSAHAGDRTQVGHSTNAGETVHAGNSKRPRPAELPSGTGPDAADQVDRLRVVSEIEEVDANQTARSSETSSHDASSRGASSRGASSQGAAGFPWPLQSMAASGDESSIGTGEQVHDHLIHLSPADLCRALGRVDTRDALLALCGLPTQVAESVMRVLPRTQSKQVRRGLDSLGPLHLREIDDAKQKVAVASLESSSVAVRDEAPGASAVPLAA